MSQSNNFPDVQWQPISALPQFVLMVDSGLDGIDEQTLVFQEALQKPHLLDDATVERARKIFTEQATYVELYDQQFARWRAASPSPVQLRELDRMKTVVTNLRTKNRAILALLDQFKGKTIDAIMAKSDLELGIEAVTRMRNQQGRGADSSEGLS